MEPGDRSESQRVIEAVNNGTLDIADLDRNVRRILEYIVKTPNFKKYKFSNKPDLEGHAQMVREAAAEGMVLLKNSGNLPMEAKGSIALFGLSAYKSIAGGTGSGNVNKPYIRNISEGLEAAGFTLDSRLTDFYAKHRDYVASQNALGMGGGGRNVLLGEAVLPEVAINRAAVQACAQRNDAAVVVIGRNAGEGDDRRMVDDFELTDVERALLRDVCNEFHKVGKKVTVVMNIGGVIETASWKGQPDAILLAWTPGQEVGNSVADVLTGKSNPSGKLSMTFPVSYLDIPSSANFPYNGQVQQQQGRGGFGGRNAGNKDIDYTNYAEGIWVGYRYFNTAGVEVSYPFGYGLSYTTFEYSKPTVKAKDGGFEATITVKNTGKVAGKEAVEIYVSAPGGGLVKPESELKAFGKTRLLQPGESQTLTFKADAYTLASFNEEASEWQTAAGKYTVKFGASATDIRATATFSGKARSWKVEKLLLPQQPVQEIAIR